MCNPTSCLPEGIRYLLPNSSDRRKVAGIGWYHSSRKRYSRRKALAKNYPGRVVPVAIVAAPRVAASVADEIKRFAVEHAPDVVVGVMDAEGFRAFWGHGLEELNSARKNSASRASSPRPSAHLFSDLNQWMLKVLLSEHIPESLLSAPRGPYRNASQLAQAAGVSVMSAFVSCERCRGRVSSKNRMDCCEWFESNPCWSAGLRRTKESWLNILRAGFCHRVKINSTPPSAPTHRRSTWP